MQLHEHELPLDVAPKGGELEILAIGRPVVPVECTGFAVAAGGARLSGPALAKLLNQAPAVVASDRPSVVIARGEAYALVSAAVVVNELDRAAPGHADHRRTALPDAGRDHVTT